MAKHWTTKLKEENLILKNDIKKIINKDAETISIYEITYKMQEENQNMIWNGSAIIVNK